MHVCVYVATCACMCVCCVGIVSAEEQEGAHSSEADAGCASGYAGEQEFDPDVESSSVIVEESDVDSDSCSRINAKLIDEVQFSVEEELQFTEWFDEDYDLPNQDNSWLKLDHAEAYVTAAPEGRHTSPFLFSEPGSSNSSFSGFTDGTSSDPPVYPPHPFTHTSLPKFLHYCSQTQPSYILITRLVIQHIIILICIKLQT